MSSSQKNKQSSSSGGGSGFGQVKASSSTSQKLKQPTKSSKKASQQVPSKQTVAASGSRKQEQDRSAEDDTLSRPGKPDRKDTQLTAQLGESTPSDTRERVQEGTNSRQLSSKPGTASQSPSTQPSEASESRAESEAGTNNGDARKAKKKPRKVEFRNTMPPEGLDPSTYRVRSSNPALSTDPRASASGGKGKGKARATDENALPSITTLSGAVNPFESYLRAGNGLEPSDESAENPPPDNGTGNKPEEGKGRAGSSSGGGGDGDNGKKGVPPRDYKFANDDGGEKLRILSRSGLPTELRWKIYSYMLDARVVEYDPMIPPPWIHQHHSTDYHMHEGRASSYDFSFELFRLNMATAIDAGTYFRKINYFIQVDWDMPGFKRLLHHFGVPIITDRPILATDLSSIIFDIQWLAPPLQQDNDGQPRMNVQGALCEPGTGSFLMLAKDFHKLCYMLRFVNQYNLPPAVYVLSGQGQPLELATVTLNHTPNFHFNVTRPRSENTELNDLWYGQCYKLLEELKEITGGGYGLTFSCRDDGNPHFTEKYQASVRSCMAPRIIWLHALYKDRIEMAKALRVDAIEHEGGAPPRLFWRYYLFFWYWNMKGRDIYARPTASMDVKASNAQFQLCMGRSGPLNFYSRIEMCALMIRERPVGQYVPPNPLGFVRRVLHLLDTESKGKWTSTMKLHLAHMHLFLTLAENENSQMAGQVRGLVWTAAQNMHAVSPHYPKAIQDLALLAPMLDQTNANPPSPNVGSVLQQTSLYDTGFWGFPIPQLWKKHPLSNMRFWQDSAALAELSNDDKRLIQKTQRDNHLAVSEFKFKKGKEKTAASAGDGKGESSSSRSKR